MVLKEAYEYMNYLKKMINLAQYHLSDTSFVTNTKQKHLLSDANPTFMDKETEVKPQNELAFTPNELIDFSMNCLDEITLLSKQISLAKKRIHDMDIDAQMNINKMIGELERVYKRMADRKSSERELTQTAYMLNAEGNQVPMRYTMIEVNTINYDRNKVKALSKKLNGIVKKTSNLKDMLELTVEVDYVPRWEIDSDLEDIVKE